jgi:hypothetical protein
VLNLDPALGNVNRIAMPPLGVLQHVQVGVVQEWDVRTHRQEPKRLTAYLLFKSIQAQQCGRLETTILKQCAISGPRNVFNIAILLHRPKYHRTEPNIFDSIGNSHLRLEASELTNTLKEGDQLAINHQIPIVPHDRMVINSDVLYRCLPIHRLHNGLQPLPVLRIQPLKVLK